MKISYLKKSTRYFLIHFYCVLISLFCSMCQPDKTSTIRNEILQEYVDDSLGQLDAMFLLKKVANNEHYSGRRYQKYIDNINLYAKNKDTLEQILYKLSLPKKRDMMNDIKVIEKDYLFRRVKNVSQTLEKVSWRNFVVKNYRTELFDYKINNSTLEYWWDSVKADYGDTVFHYGNLEDATLYLIKRVSKNLDDFTVKFGTSAICYPDLPYSSLKKIPYGSCRELSDLTTYILKAYTIPCMQDFTPNYTNIWSGHYWNAIITENGKTVPFVTPMEVDTLGHFKSQHFKLGKVYRKTSIQNDNSHAIVCGNNLYLPDFFNNPNIIDVTDEYIKCHTIKVPFNNNSGIKIENNVVYLSVFNNKIWTPIAWGQIDKNKKEIFFNKVGLGSVYMPISFVKKNLHPLNYPFIANLNGGISILKPDTSNIQKIIVRRKYPITERIEYFINRMKGGYFEVSNNPNFINAIKVFRIDSLNGENWNEKEIQTTNKYRYIRYISPIDSYCNVAELEFYNSSNDILKGRIIATEGLHPLFPNRTKELAFDGNDLTFFHAKYADSCWIGLDFGKQQEISKIRYLPRNAKNLIIPGNEYEVFYFDKEWKSLGRKIATEYQITYTNAPSNALFFIKCYTEGKEERIFTYENGEQIWW